MSDSLHYSEAIFKTFRELKFGLVLSDVYLYHLMNAATAVFTHGYRGKMVDIARISDKSRTSIAHFFNDGKWDSEQFESILKETVIKTIYRESEKTGKPILCIVDDTIASHAKPQSQALHPIEAAYWHQSHLKKRQDYGHQVVGVLLSCNDIVLNYAMVLYDKGQSEKQSKIEIVQRIAEELPVAPIKSYFLCDSWYSTSKIMDSFIAKGFYTVGALRTNRLIYPLNIKQQVKEFALHLRKEDPNIHLVTVKGRDFYVYRYEGPLKDIEDAAVVLCYPKDAFGKPKALRVFLSTDGSLTTEELLNLYAQRWNIEVFFRQCKGKLGFDKVQLRTKRGILRFWLIMSYVHLICCTSDGEVRSFEDGFYTFQREIIRERRIAIYNWGKSGLPLEDCFDDVA